MQRALAYIADKHCTVQISYLEIHNEQVFDLLNPATPLVVRWTQKAGFFVEGLYVVKCDSLLDSLQCLNEGLANRSVATHNLNKCSSRSHSLLTIYFSSCAGNGKITFVDLAGSEKLKLSQSSQQMLVESLNINKSLLSLAKCITILSKSRKRRDKAHVPFRDSKLTRLLMDSLTGSGQSLMIACINPTFANLPETLQTLRYATQGTFLH